PASPERSRPSATSTTRWTASSRSASRTTTVAVQARRVSAPARWRTAAPMRYPGGMFTFVTGGLRSGKSEYALRRASELGPPPWLYVAPHIEGDDELKARLARHRRDQEAAWKLVEAPAKLGTMVQSETLAGHGAAVVDRFTIWLSNRLNASEATADYDLIAEVEALSDKLYRSSTPIDLVTTEI